jgi:hypothetical protein
MKRLWSNLAFILRAFTAPEEEFQALFGTPSNEHLTKLREDWYDLFEITFGPHNCTYNIHQVNNLTFTSKQILDSAFQLLHLDQLRELGPISTENSFPFEGSLSVLTNCYKPGTSNIGKQVIWNHCLREMMLKHSCSKQMFLSPKQGQRTNNSLVYIFKQNEYLFYKLLSRKDDEHWIASPISIQPYHQNELRWELVGTFQLTFIQPENVVIKKADISGKAIKSGKTIQTCPKLILFEDN